MQLNITQEIKNEIDRNLSLHTALVELINKVKVAHGISELDDYYLNTICTEFKTGRYCFDDLTYTISNLVENKQITENDGTLLVQALAILFILSISFTNVVDASCGVNSSYSSNSFPISQFNNRHPSLIKPNEFKFNSNSTLFGFCANSSKILYCKCLMPKGSTYILCWFN